MIKAIIFDCFGVLTTDAWRAFCDSLPPGETVLKMRDLNHQYGSGLITHRVFLDEVATLAGYTPERLERILRNSTNKNTQLLSYIKELKNQGYKIGLISNIANNWITSEFLTKQEQALFDAMVLSHDVGVTKPDSRIYQAALEKLDLKPEECVFIDDVASYCFAAQDLGMSAIVYNDFHQTKHDLQTILDKY